MHDRLMRAVEDGDIEVLDLWEEGDGLQDNTFVGFLSFTSARLSPSI